MVLLARSVSKALCIRHLSLPLRQELRASQLLAHIWAIKSALDRTCIAAFILHHTTPHHQDHRNSVRGSYPASTIGSKNEAIDRHNAMQERRRSAAMAGVAVTPPLCYLALLLVGTAVAPCSAQVVVSIEEACRMAASSSGGASAGVSYDHCVASLASDARSRDAADLHHLAALAARIAVEHAAATEAKIEDLGEVEESPHARARLHHCLDLYNAAADVLRDALDNLHARVYGKASQQLAAALGAAESCEDVWKGEERVPVAAHDREYGRMAAVALGLTSGIA